VRLIGAELGFPGLGTRLQDEARLRLALRFVGSRDVRRGTAWMGKLGADQATDGIFVGPLQSLVRLLVVFKAPRWPDLREIALGEREWRTKGCLLALEPETERPGRCLHN
jgi:hypothetical protein